MLLDNIKVFKNLTLGVCESSASGGKRTGSKWSRNHQGNWSGISKHDSTLRKWHKIIKEKLQI